MTHASTVTVYRLFRGYVIVQLMHFFRHREFRFPCLCVSVCVSVSLSLKSAFTPNFFLAQAHIFVVIAS